MPIPMDSYSANEDIFVFFSVAILFLVMRIQWDLVKYLAYVKLLNNVSFLLP